MIWEFPDNTDNRTIYEAARQTVGLKHAGQADRHRVVTYLSGIRHSEIQLNDIELHEEKGSSLCGGDKTYQSYFCTAQR